MLTENQLKVFEKFRMNIFKKYIIKELKLDMKSNNAFSIAINKFKEENLIFEEKIGRNSIYSLNLNNLLIYNYFEIINITLLPKSVLKSINLLINSLLKNNINFYSIVIFGSYAVLKYSKDSDLDIAIIVSKKSKNDKLVIEDLKLKSLIDLDIHFIEELEFKEMLTVDYENLGKEIARKNMPILNSYIFYNLLKEGINNGFKL
ncbi:nucleotidyltransferase domain-containing protein [bacterium]|nr:nucleotidyltransferase domain-containing protein [bacterium]